VQGAEVDIDGVEKFCGSGHTESYLRYGTLSFRVQCVSRSSAWSRLDSTCSGTGLRRKAKETADIASPATAKMLATTRALDFSQRT
jgi:hypothetical protein